MHHQVVMYLGSMKSTQATRVTLGCALRNSYTTFLLSKLPTFKETHVKCFRAKMLRHNIKGGNSFLDLADRTVRAPGNLFPNEENNLTKKNVTYVRHQILTNPGCFQELPL